VPNTTLTLENIKEETETMLGKSGVTVELAPTDIKKCVKDAVRIYSRHRPFRGNAALAVNSSIKKYGPLDIKHPGFLGVVDVQFARNIQTLPLDPFSPETLLAANLLPSADTVGSYALVMQSSKDARSVLSSEPEYQGMWEEDGHFYLYIDLPQTNYLVSYAWTGAYVVEPPSTLPVAGVLPMTMIPEGDVDWILAWTLAQAKSILCRLRGKYEGITNPDGATDSVDWSQLQQESNDAIITLTDDLKARRRPLAPVTG